MSAVADTGTAQARIRRIVTPEGVAIPFEIATASDRILAFAIDALIIHGVISLLFVGAIFIIAEATAFALALIVSFLLRNFYFVYMETRWGGTTIGKRKMNLRIIARDGGPVTAEAVFARNLTRDLEVFLPVTAMFAPEAAMAGGPGWAMLIGVLWLFALALFPLLNRDRLRVGDIIGGTLVVKSPKPALLSDLVEVQPYETVWETREQIQAHYVFTTEQLDLYGIRELQVLEDVLRDPTGFDDETREKICENIKTKIGWPREDWKVNPDHFLLEFYKAQRGRLEHRMLLGERRERKKE